MPWESLRFETKTASRASLDEETGLYYCGARYLAAWLGRWTSADPLGIGADGPGLYNYTRGSPVGYTDPSGTDSKSMAEVRAQEAQLQAGREALEIEHGKGLIKQIAAQGATEGNDYDVTYDPELDGELEDLAGDACYAECLDESPDWIPPGGWDLPAGWRVEGGEMGGAGPGLAGEQGGPNAFPTETFRYNPSREGMIIGLGFGAALGVVLSPGGAAVAWDVATLVTTGSHEDPNSLAGPPLGVATLGAKTGSKFGGSAPSREEPFHILNRTHKDSMPQPKGRGPSGGRLQSHHALQDEWAKQNLPGYESGMAPTITMETGKGLPHTIVSNLQRARWHERIASGLGQWSSSLQDELGYAVSDLRAAGFGDGTIAAVMDQTYKMLDKLGVSYTRVRF